MSEKKVSRKLIIAGVSIVILLLGILSRRTSLALGTIIGLMLGLFNLRLLIRTTFRGLEFETRSKAIRYYFRTNLLKYGGIVLVICLVILSKKISLYGLISGLVLSVFFILAGIY